MMLWTCSDPSEGSVAPFGGLQALFPADPIALGIPTAADPILIDISASITTDGMIGRLRRAGRRFAGRCAMTATGEPTDDPGALSSDRPGILLPAGGRDHGHKGYDPALAVAARGQGLSGHGRTDRPTGWGASVDLQGHGPGCVRRRHRFREADQLHRRSLPQPSARTGDRRRAPAVRAGASRASATPSRPASALSRHHAGARALGQEARSHAARAGTGSPLGDARS